MTKLRARRGAGTLALSGAVLAATLEIGAAWAEPLEAYAWRARPLILFAEAADAEALLRQQALLAPAAAGLAERAAPVIVVAPKAVTIDGAPSDLSAEAMRRWYRAPEDRFQIVLVGKDTGVKLRRDAPVDPDEIFALIDGMPMRRRELGRSP